MIRSVCLFPLVCWAVLLVACASDSLIISETDTPLVPKYADENFRHFLIGHWQEVRIIDDYKYEQEIHLADDGTFEVIGIVEYKEMVHDFTWRGRWYVKDSKFGYITTYSDSAIPDLLPAAGEIFEDTILSVNDTEWIMLEQATGNKSIASRVK